MRPLPVLFMMLATSTMASDFGPIQTRNHRAHSLAFLRFVPGSSRLAVGEQRLDASITVANDFRIYGSAAGTVEDDYEVTRLGVRYSRGFDGWTLTVDGAFVSRGPGFLDPLIDGWHRTVLGWSDPIRNMTAFGRSRVSGPSFGPYGSASGIGDVSVFGTWHLGRRHSASLGFKAPFGSSGDLIGSGGFDFGAAVDGRWSLGGPWILYGQVGAVLQGDARGLPERRLVDQEAVALIWNPNSRDAWIVQWQSEASALETGVSGSDAPHRLVTFGYQRKLGQSEILELYFSEDRDLFNGAFPEGANIGPDFTMGIRYGFRF